MPFFHQKLVLKFAADILSLAMCSLAQSSDAASGVGIIYDGTITSISHIRPAGLSTSSAAPSSFPSPVVRAEFGIINETLAFNTTDNVTVHFTPENDPAFAILTNDTGPSNSSAQVSADVVRKARWLLQSNQQWLPADKSSFGNFTILNCGQPGTGSYSYGDEVREALQRMQVNLLSVDYEIRRYGLRSRYGFYSLFKTTRKRIQIEKIYEQMFVGAGVSYKPLELAPGQVITPKSTNEQPIKIICFRPDVLDQISLLGYQKCVENPYYAAMFIGSGSAIGLCPMFFHGISQTPDAQDCPQFSPSGQLPAEYYGLLTANQETVLVHELAHVYLPYSTGEEAQSLQEAMALGYMDQVANAANYAYFYSCEWPSLLAYLLRSRDESLNTSR